MGTVGKTQIQVATDVSPTPLDLNHSEIWEEHRVHNAFASPVITASTC